jgi:hypothetical protein
MTRKSPSLRRQRRSANFAAAAANAPHWSWSRPEPDVPGRPVKIAPEDFWSRLGL